MNFKSDDDTSLFRDRLRAIVDEYGWPQMQAMRAEIRDLGVERYSFAFQKRLADAGLIGITWPAPYGHGARVDQQFLMAEELETQGFPGYGLTTNQRGGGMILRNGSPEQVAEHLPKVVSAEWTYCQGLSEPQAGSDLLALKTRAERDGDDYVITLNDDDVPVLRLNGEYKRMVDRELEPNKDIRNYVKERYASALQLIKNIEQRKQTILRVCQSIVRRQGEFLEDGIDRLKPMMIKEVAEEIGVHPSTVSRAVANKYAHTPQGVFELRYFFSEGVQGPSLIDGLKTLTKQEFNEVVLNGRVPKGMPNYDGSQRVVENIDNLYGYLKGRSDGAIPEGKLEPLP